ncbi:EAL domain-containing protein [Haloimpatiens sp. FM7315]|uniref:EAL domain-containing protein n=1 Tax=Haloimpatiens sp. FM7315 TaxID=3298609 RepID=UPI00370B3E5A
MNKVKIKIRVLLKYFFIIFIPLCLALIVSVGTIFRLELINKEKAIKENQKYYTKLLKEDIEAEVKSISYDINLIKESNEFESYVSNPENTNLEKLKSMFQNVLKNKLIYKEISLVSNKGKEIYRLDRINEGKFIDYEEKPYSSKDNSFKDKYNFKTDEFTVYIFGEKTNKGYMDISFETPVFDKKSNSIGFLRLKLDYKNIMDKMKNNFNYLNNCNFTLLKGENVYINLSKNNILMNSKDFLHKLELVNNDYIESSKGVYYFETFLPKSGVKTDDYWKLVSYCSLDNLSIFKDYSFISLIITSLLFFVFILIISVIISYIVYKKKQISNKLNIYVSIFENSKEGMVVTDKNTKILYVNKSFSKITNYSEKEVIGKKTSFFKSGKHNKKFYEDMWRDIIDLGRWQGEIWDRRKGNEVYLKFLTIISVKDDYGAQSGYVGIFEDLTDLKYKEESIDKLQNYDILTALPKISLMKKLISEAIEKNLTKCNLKMYLISLSIDNYNDIKDSLGLRKMDDLIMEAVKRLEKSMDKKIVLSRTDKDEFMIFISNFKESELKKFINNVLNNINRPVIIDKESVYLKVTMGICTFFKGERDLNSIIEKANMARTYALQEQCSYIFYKEGLREKFIRKIKMDNALRNVLKNKEIYLNYQPQVDLKTNKIIGAEALLRWKSYEFGRVSPENFIPIAEKNGAIIPIGQWVLEEALKKANAWKKQYFENFCIAVNISPIQFKNTNMFETIKKALEKYDLSGESLEIEITEGVLIDNIKDIKIQLGKIKKLGVKIAMDDFGTGYSSLSYLRKFNFDKVKIDREFVKDYPEGEDGTIAKIIINLSQSLGLKVIAEGVETEEQIKFLRNNFCDQIQGYYYSPPLSDWEFEKLLRKNIMEEI